MSLHALANHLQEAGRGQDKVLVHMTPKEVSGLQSLAMAHGGSLTVNPQTGLPEAGFLSSILPMIAGFALNAFLPGVGTAVGSALGGLSGAAGTGILVGGVTGLAKGSLKDGIMAGLGAYGGAGLSEGLMTAGAPANVTPSVSDPTLGGFSQNPALANVGTGSTTTLGSDTFANVAKEAGVPTVTNAGGYSGMPAYNNQSIMFQNVPSSFTPTPISPTAVTPSVQTPVFDISKYAPSNNAGFTNLGEASRLTPGSLVNATPNVPITNNVVDLSKQGISDLASQTRPVNMNMSVPGGGQATRLVEGPMSVPRSPLLEKPVDTSTALGRGFDRATSSFEGAKEVWNATPKGTGLGLAATGMSIMQSQQEEEAAAAQAAADAAAAERRGYMRPYEFSTALSENAFAPRASTSETRYFVEPRFTAGPVTKVAKDGGLMSLAVGGPVEEMSAQNAISGNMMYPQAQLQTDMYSNPMVQRPMPNNVISSGIDTPVGMYTGEQRMAEGGSTNTKYSYNPETMKYTQATTTPPPTYNNQITGNPLIDGIFGMAPHFRTMGGGNFGGGLIKNLQRQMAAQQPTTTIQTSGGAAAPYIPTGLEAAASNMPMVPNIKLQPQRTPEQQLGLEAFYPMMEQRLARRNEQMEQQGYAIGGMASGGYSLGGYSDGGRLLKGPGDGVSDSIPASIGDHQPARLADGEFVVPARIVSEIGNGSTEAGARKLYAMMDRVQKARGKTTGKNQVAKNTKAERLLPA